MINWWHDGTDDRSHATGATAWSKLVVGVDQSLDIRHHFFRLFGDMDGHDSRKGENIAMIDVIAEGGVIVVVGGGSEI